MKKELEIKIQGLMTKAKEGKAQTEDERKHISSNIHNSLADNIKTREQAKSFMTLVKAL